MHHDAPPQPPQKRSTRKTIGLGCAGIAALCVAIIAVGAAAGDKDDGAGAKHSASHSAGTRRAPTPKATDTALSKREVTRLSVGVVWDSYSEKERDALCLGVDLYGTDWLAKQMHSDNLDPDYAAELVADRCATH
ncbi:hypothetical protein [Streptomyces spiralis]